MSGRILRRVRLPLLFAGAMTLLVLWNVRGMPASADPAPGQLEEWSVGTYARYFQAELAVGEGGYVWYLQGSVYEGNFGVAERMTGPGQPSVVSLGHGAAGIDITRGPDGNMWLTEEHSRRYEEVTEPDSIGRLEPDESLTEFPITPTEAPINNGHGPVAIVSGPNGNLWFTDQRPDAQHQMFIGEMTTSGVLTEHPLAAGTGKNEASVPKPSGIARGPEGYIWFTDDGTNEDGKNLVGRMSPTGAVEEFPVPTPGAEPAAIATGADGAMWFTEPGESKIGRVAPSGDVTEFPVPNVTEALQGLARGPEGNLWFAEQEPIPGFGSISPTGEVRSYYPAFEPSTSQFDVVGPSALVLGSDGYLWFTDPRFVDEFTRVPTTDRGRFAIPLPPVNIQPPSVYGVPLVGAVLSASPGNWRNAPTGETYQWQRCSTGDSGCESLPGEQAFTYLVSERDIGHWIRVDVSASNAAGTGSTESEPVGPVQPKPLPKAEAQTVKVAVVGATITSQLAHSRHGIVVRSLVLHGVAGGSTVHVSCRGSGCALRSPGKKGGRAVCARRTCTWTQYVPSGHLVNLSELMRYMHLGRGTRLIIVVTRPGSVGRAFEFRVAGKGIPSPKLSCRAPNSVVVVAPC